MKKNILQDVINKKEITLAIGAHDALSAKLVERAGFNAVYIGSYSLEATQKGNPDIDIMTKTEKLSVIRDIINAVNIPVIADMEEGYGDAISIIKTIPEFESTGLAAVHLDDQSIPSRCPFLPNLPKIKLISTEEMCCKIKAAVDSRSDTNFMIIARTDVLGTVSLEKYYRDNLIMEVVRRSNAYFEAGADAIFIMALNKEELKYYASNIKAPLVGYIGLLEPIPLEEFKKAGCRIILATNVCMNSAVKGIIETLKLLKETEDFNIIKDHLINDNKLYEIINIKEYVKYYKKYGIK